MSVIIRLQNLPWSANSLDIRQFFKGLSIPEGGVHIVGGEMGDAFIAFSTDEDARLAMMRDREKINEVQVRLLLSSRAEMLKVIETARQQSALALQNAGALAPPKINTPLPTPQPPVITTNSLQNILSNQLGPAPSFLTYQQQAGITLDQKPNVDKLESMSTSRRGSLEASRDRRRSNSRDRRSRSRDRNDRNDRQSSSRRRRDKSRSRSRERDWKGRRNSRRSKSRERSHERSRERNRSRDRNRNTNRNNRNSKDKDSGSFGSRSTKDNFNNNNRSNGPRGLDSNESKPKMPVISPWSIPPVNAYQTNFALETAAAIKIPNQSLSSTPLIQGGGNPLNPFNTTNVNMPGRNVVIPNQIVPNAYTTSLNKPVETARITSFPAAMSAATAAATVIPGFQSFTSNSSNSTTNNYSINLLGSSNSSSNDSIKPFALQNPYTAAIQAANTNSNSPDSRNSSPALAAVQSQPQSNAIFGGYFLDKKPETTTVSPQVDTAPAINFQQIQQEAITFANTNPYAQMYPNLFAQAAAIGTNTTKNTAVQPTATALDKLQESPTRDERKFDNLEESCSIRISNLCGSTTYSDIRKFFSGLFIPHNGIKMVNDKHGLRIGIAYIQFSRLSSVAKAMIRNNTMLKTKQVKLEMVPDAEFDDTADSFRPQGRDRGGYGNRNDSDGRRDAHNAPEHFNPFGSSSHKTDPFSVLYIEDIPTLATEQDVMKMFSAYTIYDILLTVSPENRREFIAYVKFSREEEAKSALEDKSTHMIGNRKVRVRPGRANEMEKAKEKLRLANEQLMKEEQELAEEADKEQQLKSAEEAQIHNIDDDDDDDDVMHINDNDDNIDDLRRNTLQGNNSNDIDLNKDPRAPNIPSIFELSASRPESSSPATNAPSDPRLRRAMPNRFENNNNQRENSNSNDMPPMQPNNNFNPNFNNDFNHDMPPMPAPQYSMNSSENCFVILKNCDYNTRINEIADMFLSTNLSLKHIEPLRNERKMPNGEFIVEFRDPRDAEVAYNDFNNTPFRSRNLRVHPICPQEIADRLRKPFMNYFPGGGPRRGPGPPHMRGGGNMEFMGRGGPGGPGGNMMDFPPGGGNMGPMRFGNMGPMRGGPGGPGGRNMHGMDFNGPIGPMHGMRRGNNGGGGMGRGGMNYNFNNNNNNNQSDRDDDEMHNNRNDDDNMDNNDRDDDDNDNNDDKVNDNDDVGDEDNDSGNGDEKDTPGISEKFNRPGCVVAMENVPFGADLKDIMKFFNDFELTPDDIIRRFNDNGTPTGDARVAFNTPDIARSAFDAKKKKQIFNRTIFLSIL